MKKALFSMAAVIALAGAQPEFALAAEPQYPPEPDIHAHLPPWIMPPGPNPDSQYRLGPDSLPQPGVPKGEIRGPFVIQSHVFPGTQHTYWVYVPAQYDPSKPADLMVFQDGWAFKAEDGQVRAQNVMDNLIYRREIPVMIGVFLTRGDGPISPSRAPRRAGAMAHPTGSSSTTRRTTNTRAWSPRSCCR